MNQHVMDILDSIKNSYQFILKSNLVGIYVHGSIAFHCFNWNKSDIDFLVVTQVPPSQEEKEALIQVLLDLEPDAPEKGLEMSIVLERDCKPFVYPTPFELHFSNMHKERCRTDLEEYCKTMNGTDKDLAAHFTVICNAGITLYGKEIACVFGEVPKAAYIDSQKYDIEDALDDVLDDPMYIILTLCRVLAFVKDDFVVSKQQGGQWGIHNLPEQYHELIQDALDSYVKDTSFSIDEKSAVAFTKYMLEQITSYETEN